jgi:hypothetical protein
VRTRPPHPGHLASLALLTCAGTLLAGVPVNSNEKILKVTLGG